MTLGRNYLTLSYGLRSLFALKFSKLPGVLTQSGKSPKIVKFSSANGFLFSVSLV